MNYLDIIIIVVLLLGFVLGYKDGIVRKIIGFIGFIVAIVLSIIFSEYFGKFISPIFSGDQYLSSIVAGVTVFFLVIFFFSVLKRVLHPIDKVNSFVNQFLGGIAGAIQIIFFISGFLLFLNIFKVPSESARKESYLYNKAFNIIPVTIDFFLGSGSDAKNLVQSFIDNKDKISIDKKTDSINLDLQRK